MKVLRLALIFFPVLIRKDDRLKSKQSRQVLVANIKGGMEKPIFSVFVCLEKSRKGLLSYGCSCVCCKMNWNSVVLLLMTVEIRKTLRKTSQSKGDNQQESQPTCDEDSGIRTRW